MPPAPTVPLLKPSLGGEASRAGRFRVAAPEPGVLAPLPPGSISDRNRSRFPRGLPDQGRSPGGSPFGGLELTSLFPPSRFLRRSFGSDDGGILGRSLGFRLTAMDRSPGSADFAAPGPKPGPARKIRSRSSFLPGGGAETEVPLSAGLVLNPKVRCPACWSPTCPKAALRPMGAFEAGRFRIRKGQARSFRLAAASSAALPFASTCPAARRRPAWLRLRLWLGRLSPVAGRSSRPPRKAVMKSDSVQAQSACG